MYGTTYPTLPIPYVLRYTGLVAPPSVGPVGPQRPSRPMRPGCLDHEHTNIQVRSREHTKSDSATRRTAAVFSYYSPSVLGPLT